MNFENLKWDRSSTINWIKGMPNTDLTNHQQDLIVDLTNVPDNNIENHQQDLEVSGSALESMDDGEEISNHRQDLDVFWENVSLKAGRRYSNVGEKVCPITVLKGHTNDVTCVDFAGRSLLATASSDKSIRVYKWQPGDTFKEVSYSPLEGHRYGINCIAFSPFGSKLASASTDGYTIIWDVKSGDKLCGLRAPRDAAIRVCGFSPNSSYLATGGDDDHAAIWDVSTLSLLREVGSHDSTVTSISFTPDNNFLATGCSGGELRVWDTRYGHTIPLFTKAEAHDLGVSSIHFNPSIGKEDNQILGKQYLLASGGQDTDLQLWILEIGKPIIKDNKSQDSPAITLYNTLCGHTSSILAVKFSPNGKILASASGDKTVRLWDPVRATPISVLEGPKRYVTSCAFSDDGALLAAGSGDRSVFVWQVDNAMKTRSKPSSNSQLPHRFPIRFRENKRLPEWTTEDVCSWLADQGLAEYAPNFRIHAIDGRELISTSENTLESKLGVDALGHRSKILRLINKYNKMQALETESTDIPTEFLCPITQELISDPVLCADGFTYERFAIEAWLSSGKVTSPMTNEVFTHKILTPNRTLRTLIQKYKEENL